jgi:6-pyruvoyltetrahydropterin/6-carboxytetrahydropterin synthase
MPITVSRRFEFDAAHRVLNHEGKCRHLHGHRYVAEVTVEADGLDPIGRVIDYSILKTEIGGWIDKNWDHNTLLHPGDPLVRLYRTAVESSALPNRDKSEFTLLLENAFLGKQPYTLPTGNPTAENIAAHLFHVAWDILRPFSLKIRRVTVWETPNCRADFDGTYSGGTV